MTRVQVVFWRQIPAQVKARQGSERASRPLSDRFQQAIDDAAMGAGLSGTDAYLAEWHTSEGEDRAGEPPGAGGAARGSPPTRPRGSLRWQRRVESIRSHCAETCGNSPSPWPSPSGRGERNTLSRRERVGVRGNVSERTMCSTSFF